MRPWGPLSCTFSGVGLPEGVRAEEEGTSHLELCPAPKWPRIGGSGMPVPGACVGVCVPVCAGVEWWHLSVWLILGSTCVFLGTENWIDTQPVWPPPCLRSQSEGQVDTYWCHRYPPPPSNPPGSIFMEQLPVALPLPCPIPQDTPSVFPPASTARF